MRSTANIVTPQDVAVPYMLDPRHPEDTVFLFFEADFRFYERDCVEPAQWLPLVVGDAHLQLGGAGRPSSSSAVLQIQNESREDPTAAASAQGRQEKDSTDTLRHIRA